MWAPAALFLALTGRWGKAVILSVWGVGVVSLIDNLLYPILVGRGDHWPRLERHDGRPRGYMAPPHRGGPRSRGRGECVGRGRHAPSIDCHVLEVLRQPLEENVRSIPSPEHSQP